MTRHDRESTSQKRGSQLCRRQERGGVALSVLLFLLVLGVFGAWCSQGAYRIASGEGAAILRFGVYHHSEVATGWRLHWPPPLESHVIVNLQEVQQEAFGPTGPAPLLERALGQAGAAPAVPATEATTTVPPQPVDATLSAPAAPTEMATNEAAADSAEATEVLAHYAADAARWREVAMQTRDHSIVYVPFTLHCRVRDMAAYVNRLAPTREFVRDAAQAAMREEISRVSVDQLFEDRIRVQDAVRSTLQGFFDRYYGSAAKVGIEVESVQIRELVLPQAAQEAGEAVREARQWKEQQLAEANQYQTAQRYHAKQYETRLRESSAAYAVERVAQAEARRTEFLQLLPVYRAAPEVTRRRLYLETMEAVFATTNTLVIEKGLPSVPSVPPRRELPPVSQATPPSQPMPATAPVAP